MTMADVSAVLVLGHAAAQESPRYRDRGWDEDKLRSIFGHILPQPDHGFFVAEDESGIFGMVLGLVAPYFFSDKTYASDLLLYVEPTRRGSPTAVRLVRRFESWAFEQGVEEILLGISTGINPEATVCVYERLGYRVATYGLTKQRSPASV